MIGRLVITDIRPQVACGRWPVRAVAGETLRVEATVFREGHDAVGADVVLRGPGGRRPTRHPMTDLGHDRWTAELPLDATGRWSYLIEAYDAPLATWRHKLEVKHGAGQDVEVELQEGAQLLEELVAQVPRAQRGVLQEAIGVLREKGDETEARVAAGLDPVLASVLETHPLRRLVTPSERIHIWADRQRALYGAWYEFFPRSEGATDGRGGTLRTAMARLPAIAEMGFDVVYLPPIHPIGRTFRKGPNNTLDAAPSDPGSPWAIGSEEGGHDAIHPELGTFEDFDAFVARTGELGMEVALDLALQCAPDHPWVSQHPEWFTARADGSIAYAENPPKKYQDIYPLNFDNDPTGLYEEVLRVVRLWMAHGVRIFRVDNPHTKPLDFWEWLITEIKRSDPDVIFLAEAFTRPPMMQMLARIGFHQSYTYFTWRNAKWELEQYLRELAHSDVADYMRPNFFVNTPDILHAYLQYGGPPAFKIRAVLAAMLSPSYGVYSGFELFESHAVREGSEEYLDSEKYQHRPRDWSQPSLAPYLTRINEIRRAHPALHWLRNVHFHHVDNDDVMAFSKREGDDVVLVVVNVDPHATHEATIHLDLAALGLGDADSFEVRDLLADTWYVWHGPSNYVRLDPFVEPAHIFSVTAL